MKTKYLKYDGIALFSGICAIVVFFIVPVLFGIYLTAMKLIADFFYDKWLAERFLRTFQTPIIVCFLIYILVNILLNAVSYISGIVAIIKMKKGPVRLWKVIVGWLLTIPFWLFIFTAYFFTITWVD